MTDQNAIKWESRPDGIVVLTMDDPNQSANTMNAAYITSMKATVDRLEAERESVTGVILTSAKKTFFAGGDLNDLLAVTPEQSESFFRSAEGIKADLRRLEKLGKPVVAAINGAALGGGLEIALACHHRVALSGKGTQIGLPEVGLGLLPGGGGVTRTVRLLGITEALTKVLLQGQKYSAERAAEVGLIDDTAASPEELISKSVSWIEANPEAAAPWDVKDYRIPGGTPSTPAFAANLPALPANIRKQTRGTNLPAPQAIVAAAVEGSQVDFDTASTIESRYLTELATGQVAKNMIQAFFFDLQHINSGGSRPDGYPNHTAHKAVVLGAGMMGAGIAHVCAKAGIDVVLKDVSLESAERGKAYSVKIVDKAVARGTMTRENADALLARIHPTDKPEDADGADLVIEAVFEDPALKASVFKEIEQYLAPDAVLGSNTSTLPISGLSQNVSRPADFVGLHFFSPVNKMNLLEIIVGDQTSDATLAKAIDISQQIRKTPIVVNDSRGFFTSRVIGKFLDEAIAMVGEGIDPSSIEQAGLQAGYPAAPLQLYDELTLTLPRKIREETKAAAIADGTGWQTHGSEPVVDRLIDEYDRKGRSTGGGFYAYADGKRTEIWPGIREHFTKDGYEIPFEDMKERMLFAEAIDTIKCFDEGVLRSVPDANIGSVFGIGFPAWTGGVMQYVNGYKGGLAGFVERTRYLADKYGARFEPPASLIEKADKGELYT
ncbi:3-hydroxyacyl-CoA dehydrogenase [Rhodococcus sp. 15-725-2-2b]|uniref:3-hydroxyacyl-CoA dehydrogenase NAD-binding domain-containing protein n=1 Tax=unclassified Rhodococcus (in: high G+C Gram-positive bacteria) TaxID=192944 RepID=UPI000B9B55E0|nr:MULTISPECIES: 3-hydroxyacyl-CoA dehydrogenase NAD-binding domain-containing protein [unclassified Rhodococcus (in: high G+C Gram-positive bacteria)]OZC63655.1 3-hydroxyacyl-CoA dehydrogenase [Rhodococcus sp. 06-469-3-2]OZD40820.1 3-hydroxyacyl-CoA dehydrogenase [Rhodococcus sp. 06-1477-1A]OZE67072.1 3-hydroxyacyl-CoA dehydrogenase [Rhodococcus sp. 15-725-2-2b]